MPEAIIELDVSAAWEPPERPGPAVARRRRKWRRVLLTLAVFAAATLVPAGAAAGHGLDPLYAVEFQVLAVDAAGGRILVHRYGPTGTDPVAEALDARTGRVLWQRAGRTDQSYVGLTDQVGLVQTERTDSDGAFTGYLQAFDAATGHDLWRRDDVRPVGLAPGGTVVVQEQAWPGEDDGFDPSYGNPDDASVALPQLPHHERFIGLDELTGAARWTTDLAPGTLPRFDYRDYPRISGFAELSAAGVLRNRDLTTGAVTSQYPLNLDGTIAQHWAGLPGQEVVLAAGRDGASVYDWATGRRLWRWTSELPAFNGPVPCLRVHYCVFGDSDTAVLDAADGKVLWRARGYTALLRDLGDRLLMFRQVKDDIHPSDVAAFDGGTGAVLWRRQGWFLANGYFNAPRVGGTFVWRSTSTTDAVIGQLDPRDGTVRVIGRAPDFYGTPQCTATATRVACLAIGVLYVWPHP
ncbi:PQQ-binding-like beta-propeller repeat protein [Dactylosporangium vinaceum]|uniref:PQQ-binding-like beta-propeller repeat protein n=1 Tax=Dactylosporangium vinaceum TaxID=53362 RepID=A0ABV5LYM0_9ACTN|nr:PQQ-binding-like beta-propeller repeat protein [Dactylosporangium vinaceum]UAB98253.1 PQQ-binding-like beta-propeller repeat protein [Dactylosporangium vinaceum]